MSDSCLHLLSESALTCRPLGAFNGRLGTDAIGFYLSAHPLDAFSLALKELDAKKVSEINQNQVKMNGHSIECRINAVNPDNFTPSPGTINKYHQPGGFGIRIESAIYQGYKVPPHYDSMIAKVISYGVNREESISRIKRALEEYVIIGIDNTIQLHQDIIKDDNFISGNYDINFMNEFGK